MLGWGRLPTLRWLATASCSGECWQLAAAISVCEPVCGYRRRSPALLAYGHVPGGARCLLTAQIDLNPARLFAEDATAGITDTAGDYRTFRGAGEAPR